MRMRKKPNLLPRLEKCSPVIISEPESMRGHWRTRSGCKKLFVELGCGKGRFTSETAKNLDDTLLMAVERVREAMVVAAERVIAAEQKNVLFSNIDAEKLPLILAPGEADRLYINFCDPWPGNRHAKRRLTSGRFLQLYRELLCEGGEIWFKTDNSELFEYSLEQFKENGFSLHEVTRDLHKDGPVGVMTDYEIKFHAQGVKINRCAARKETISV